MTTQFEIILVNDGSRDRSWNVVSKLAAEGPQIRGINLMRNYGQHNALLCGIRAAKHELVLTLDDDLQHPPEEVAKLLARLDDSLDVVYGTPDHHQSGLLRSIASQVTRFALRTAVGPEVARNVSAFRVFRSELREAFAAYHTPFVSIDVLLTWATARFGAVTVRHEARGAGASNYTFRNLLRHAVDMMTGFSTMPLQLASWIGFGCTVFGICVLLFVVIRYLLEGSVAGFPFLASIIAIFSGAQLFALGVIGEYLARMHFRSMNRPAYVVRSAT